MTPKLYYIKLSKDQCEKQLQDLLSFNLSPESILLFAQMVGCEVSNLQKGRVHDETYIQWDLLKEVMPNTGKQDAQALINANFAFATTKGFKLNGKVILGYSKMVDSTGVSFTNYIMKHFKQNNSDPYADLLNQFQTFKQKAINEINSLRSRVQYLEEQSNLNKNTMQEEKESA